MSHEPTATPTREPGVDPQPFATPSAPGWLIPTLAIVATIAGVAAIYAARQLQATAPAGDAPIILGAAGTEDPNALRGFQIRPERPAPDFSLTDQHGDELALSDLEGKTVLLFFGFTQCPDICPTTLLTLGQGLSQLGPAAEEVRIVFVSVDPERDTTDKIGAYVKAFHEGAIGLRGELPLIESIAEDYGVQFAKEWAEGDDPETAPYTMAHTATVFLIDPFGQLRAGFLNPTPEDVAHDLRLILEEFAG